MCGDIYFTIGRLMAFIVFMLFMIYPATKEGRKTIVETLIDWDLLPDLDEYDEIGKTNFAKIGFVFTICFLIYTFFAIVLSIVVVPIYPFLIIGLGLGYIFLKDHKIKKK